jgi:hypothetical protein
VATACLARVMTAKAAASDFVTAMLINENVCGSVKRVIPTRAKCVLDGQTSDEVELMSERQKARVEPAMFGPALTCYADEYLDHTKPRGPASLYIESRPSLTPSWKGCYLGIETV